MRERLLRSAEDTAALGADVAAALGVRGAIRSPTYTLLEPYELPGRLLVHLDLYRLAEPRELEPLGLRDYPPERCWWLIEWPERAAGRLPPAELTVDLSHEGQGRQARLAGPAATAVVAKIHQTKV